MSTLFSSLHQVCLLSYLKKSSQSSHPPIGLLKPDLDARELLPEDVEHVRVEETEEQGDHESL